MNLHQLVPWIGMVTALLVAGPLTAAVGPHCPDIAGQWTWFVGGMVIVSSDGTGKWKASPEASSSIALTWQCQPATGVYTFTWEQGMVDTLTLSADGRTLSGHNQHGVTVAGEFYDSASQRETPDPASTIDPALVGFWALEVLLPTPQGPVPVLWEIRPDGTYAVDARHLSHAGTLSARDGQWRLEAQTNAFRDNGSYQIVDWTTLVTHAQAGVGRWHRYEPHLVLETVSIKAQTLPKNLPTLVKGAQTLAKRWRTDAIPVMVELDTLKQVFDGSMAVRFNFFSPSTGGGLWIWVSSKGSRLKETPAANWGGRGIPFDFLDLPEAWATARQYGVPPPLKRAMLRIWEPKGVGSVLAWSITSAQHDASGINIDGTSGIVLEGDLAGYVAEYNRMWQQAVEGLRQLFARPVPRPSLSFGFDSNSSSSSSSSSSSGTGSSSPQDNGTALQNAWGANDMNAYNRIQSGTPTWEDCSRYGGC